MQARMACLPLLVQRTCDPQFHVSEEERMKAQSMALEKAIWHATKIAKETCKVRFPLPLVLMSLIHRCIF